MGILRIKKAKKNPLLCRLDGQLKKTGWPEIPKPRQSKKETDTGSSLIFNWQWQQDYWNREIRSYNGMKKKFIKQPWKVPNSNFAQKLQISIH